MVKLDQSFSYLIQFLLAVDSADPEDDELDDVGWKMSRDDVDDDLVKLSPILEVPRNPFLSLQHSWPAVPQRDAWLGSNVGLNT